MKRDRFGIPVLDAAGLERVAEGFLQRYCPSVLAEPGFTPLAQILDALSQSGNLVVDLNSHLGYSPEGHRYLGWFEPLTRTIRIDESLSRTNDARFSFTVAHELGHSVLHSEVDLGAIGQSSDIRDSSRELTINRLESSKPRSLMEWQANRFAAGILLPRRTVGVAVAVVQAGLGIRRNLGTVWIDASDSSKRDFMSTVEHLAALYDTSKAVVRYRLEELSLLRDFRPRSGGFESFSPYAAALPKDETPSS